MRKLIILILSLCIIIMSQQVLSASIYFNIPGPAGMDGKNGTNGQSTNITVFNNGDGTYLWRDLLDIGFNESNTTPLDYPFLNGCHYMYDNYCFYVRRQDPFDEWGIFWSTFPNDPIGYVMTDQFNVNSEDDVC